MARAIGVHFRRDGGQNAVVTQHAENAAFLWLLRNGAVNEPNYALKDLAIQDDRVEANLDGLHIAVEAGWQLLGLK
jgi:hypothetical protein